MAFTLKDITKVQKQINDAAKRIESALIYQLEFTVAKLENHAKLSAGYQDQTSNLKSSIGGVVLKDRRPISYSGFQNEADATDGSGTGLEFINTLIANVGTGYVIIVVAGMDYATYVENEYGLNVLKKTELKMESEMRKVIAKLKRTIK